MADYIVGQTITVTNPVQDVEQYLVEKDIDGGGYVEVGIYSVPREIIAGSGEVEEILQYTFAYQYVTLLEDIGALTLRFTPLAPGADQDIIVSGSHTVYQVEAGEIIQNRLFLTDFILSL